VPGSGFRSRLLPVDVWVLGYGLALSAIWLPFAGSSATARRYLAFHAALLAIPVLLLLRDASGRRLGLLREIYPLLLMAGFWPELGAHYRVAGGLSHDAAVASVEHALFGGQPSLSWGALASAKWIRALMETAYLAYYPVLIAVPVWILGSGPREAVRELVLYTCVVYLGCFLVYAAYPVLGPFHFFGIEHAGLPQSSLQQAETAIRTSGDSLGTAFPSSHVAGCVAFAFLAFRWAPRWAGLVSGVAAVLVCPAVVYTHHHYAIDALSGLVLGLAAGIAMLARRAAVVPTLGQLAPTTPGGVSAT
jgi:membrane-associated phospholipid phosphatase